MESEKPEKPKKPFGRSLSDFGELKFGERELLEACENGLVAELGPTVPESATNENCVRAEFLRFLLLGGDEEAPVHERGVQLHGAYVEGVLMLRSCSIPVSFMFQKCFFPLQINAQDAVVSGVFGLSGSHLANGLVADRLKCAAGIFLRQGFKAKGEVNLAGAHIGDDIDCNDGHFESEKGAALSADRANVKGSIIFSNGFTARGAVTLPNAQIAGNLNCSGGHFEVEKGVAINAHKINVECSVLLNSGFNTKGEVALQGARIGANLNCQSGNFTVEKGNALSADRLNVSGDVYMNRDFKSQGAVRFTGGFIGGSFICSGGSFDNEAGDALTLERTNVSGSVYLRDDFKAIGRVTLTATQIGSILSCDRGHFEVKKGWALYGERLNVKGNVCMRKGFRAVGGVSLKGAQIGGNLECNQGHFEVKTGAAFSLSYSVVQGVWLFKELAEPVCIDASHTQVGVLDDGNLQAWGVGSVLDGFRYASLGGDASTKGEERLKWLNNQPKSHLNARDFRPQPWRQLQRGLREIGHAEDAKQVGIAYEDHLRKIGRVGKTPKDTVLELAWLMRLVTRGAHWAFGQLAGYGYRPVRLVIWMLGVWLVCGAAYWWLALPPRSALAPSDPLVFQDDRYKKCPPDHLDEEGKKGNWYICSSLRGEYASFSPLAYSLDLLLPVVDLGQEKSWDAFIPETKKSPEEEFFFNWHWGHAARLLNWIETLFGWVGSLLLVAIISGFSRRNDES